MKKALSRFLFVFVAAIFVCGTITATPPLTFDGTASFELNDSDTLVIGSGTTSLTGDRVISVSDASATAVVKIGATVGSGEVVLQPATDTDAILLFDAVTPTSVIEVQVLNDLTFQGNSTKPLFVGVRGKGKVKFRLPWGRVLVFSSTDSSTPGAHLRILMEQNLIQMQTSSQLSFESWAYASDEVVNTDPDAHTLIIMGQNSSCGFISQHKSGLVDESGALDYGYGSICFDPSNSGRGRMVLRINAGDTPVDFTDGSFMIYGSYVEGTGLTSTEVLTADMRTNVVHKYRAGLGATMRIDNAIGLAAAGEDAEAYITDSAYARGLVVINHNRSFPLLANNYDQTTAGLDHEEEYTGLTDSKYFLANTVQTGFVLGNNGIIEVQNGRFLDYFAGGINAPSSQFPVAGTHVATGATATDGTHSDTKVKKHNPSALIIDGYAYRKTGTTAADDVSFEYDAPTTDYAQILLYGNAKLFARVAAASGSGLVGARTIDADGTTHTGFEGHYINCTLGAASYDGSSVMIRDDEGNPVSSISTLGEVAIDIEGPVKIFSLPSVDGFVDALGAINLPSVLLDHTGSEMVFSDDELSSTDSVRPLVIDSSTTYYRYNNSSILVNDFMVLDKVRLVHNDVGRDVSAMGTGQAIPAIIGGELPSLRIAKNLADDPSYWVLGYTGSPIYLYDSIIECHESLVTAGVRWVVHDRALTLNLDGSPIEDETLADGDNTSRLVFYNRGYAYDLEVSGMGRYFQLGSRLNTMADGETLDPLALADGTYPQSSLRDAFIDVYRQHPAPPSLLESESDANTIKFSLGVAYEEGVPTAEKSMHVVHLSDRSQVNLGWPAGQYIKVITTSDGTENIPTIEADSRYVPWEYTDSILDLLRSSIDLSGDPENAHGYRFAPYAHGSGVFEFSGETIFVDGAGRYNSAGVLTPSDNEFAPRGVRDRGGSLYVDFGGTLTATNSCDVILNTVIGRRTCNSAIANGAGLIDIDSDQLIFQPYGKIETYGFNIDTNPNPPLMSGSNTPIVSINVGQLPVPEGFVPVKGIDFRAPPLHWPFDRRSLIRSTESVTTPVTMPTSGLLVMASGDSIDQMQIFGATRALPFHFRMTGDGTGFSRVREFVSMASEPAVAGEGEFAALFLDMGARIGLGSRHWNAQSANAWNKLGLDKVSLIPNGNCVVDLNSDLIITDSIPLLATTGFGEGSTVHQIVFYSDVPREIRLPAGTTWDLGSFGRGGPNCQQIVFAGQTRLVIEPGAKIRFPNTVTSGNHACGPVLYFTDNSQCVFMSNNNPDASWWSDVLNGSDKVRSKLMGIGKIWLNKNAKMTIFDDALVGVEADTLSPVTDITISLQRQSRVLIGDETHAGGALQIGNVVQGGGDGTNGRVEEGSSPTPTSISFTLTLNGENANFHIDRSGFFGLAAGIVNKKGNPNGSTDSSTDSTTGITTGDDQSLDPDHHYYDAWRVQSLSDVRSIALNITRGYFDHNQIYDGSNTSNASYGSLIALGALDYNSDVPLDIINGGQYSLSMGAGTDAFMRGGGNIIFVDAGVPGTDPYPVSIWNYSADITSSSNTGKYTIMAPSSMIRTYSTPVGLETITDASSNPYVIGGTYLFEGRSVTDADSQGGSLIELYLTLSMPIYGGYPAKFVAAGASLSGVTASYLLGNTIIRQNVIIAKDKFGNSVSPTFALAKGYFNGTSPGGNAVGGRPETFVVP